MARIPKSLVLSHQTSSLSRLLPSFTSSLQHLATTVQLSIHVLYELQLGDRSRWKGYFDHCPKETVDIGLLWEEEGNARNWVRGTELERELRRLGITKVSETHLSSMSASLTLSYPLQASLSTIFHSVVLPLFSSLPSTSALPPPRLDTFLSAYSLVSSRAFQVDTYHSLALVPFADAFNHSSPNHVHFASDTWVCEECGQLEECPHDDSNEGERKVRREEGGDDQTCDMVTTNEGVLEGEEVFNSYGNLSNARLIAEYGFALEANEWDTISFEEEEVHEVLSRYGGASVESDLTVRPSELEEEDHPLIAPSSSRFSRSLYFDADARLSHALWTKVALSVLRRYRPKSADRQNNSARLNELAQTLASLVAEEEGKEELGEDLGIDETDSVILGGIARIMIDLCSTRLRGQYRPELTGTQLLDLAEVRLCFLLLFRRDYRLM